MPLDTFIGNAEAVNEVRRLVADRRAQRALILAGPEGIGKTTLALMVGLALNCENPPAPGDFCGHCASCSQAQTPAMLPELIESAVEYRQTEVKGEVKQTAPLMVAPHPAIRYFPPDGEYLTIHQARAAMRLNQQEPDRGKTWCIILADLDRARWMVQAALLKTLEEPSPRVTLIGLARNPLELLSTVRSRALVVTLSPMTPGDLANRLGEGNRAEARLRAQLAQGCPGRALTLDLAAFRQLRQEALVLLREGLQQGLTGLSARVTESTRAGKERFETLVEILYSVIQDILYLHSDLSQSVRNMDVMTELTKMAQLMQPESLPRAVEGLDRLLSAARRNVSRPMALDAWALGLQEG